MIESPTIVSHDAERVAVIHIVVPRPDMPKVFGPAIHELFGVLAAQGVKPGGPIFAHHLKMSMETFDFEVGVPVASDVKPSGRVKPGELPAAARVARTIYQGPYEGMFGAWDAFTKWMTEQKLERAPHLWERYVVGPEQGPDPATWRTELNQPLL